MWHPYRYGLLHGGVATFDGSRRFGVHHEQGSTIMVSKPTT